MELRELVDSIADEIYKVIIKNKQQNKDKQTIKLDGSKIYFDNSVGKIRKRNMKNKKKKYNK